VQNTHISSLFTIHSYLARKGAVNGGSKPPPYRHDNAQPVGATCGRPLNSAEIKKANTVRPYDMI